MYVLRYMQRGVCVSGDFIVKTNASAQRFGHTHTHTNIRTYTYINTYIHAYIHTYTRSPPNLRDPLGLIRSLSPAAIVHQGSVSCKLAFSRSTQLMQRNIKFRTVNGIQSRINRIIGFILSIPWGSIRRFNRYPRNDMHGIHYRRPYQDLFSNRPTTIIKHNHSLTRTLSPLRSTHTPPIHLTPTLPLFTSHPHSLTHHHTHTMLSFCHTKSSPPLTYFTGS